MTDFLVVVGDSDVAAAWWERGIEIARAQGFGEPTGQLVRPALRAATFARWAADGSRLAIGAGDDWLIGSGTWLGPDGLRPGREAELLERAAHRGLRDTLRVLDGFFALVCGSADGVRIATDLIGSHQVHTRTGRGATAIAGSALWLAALDATPLDPIGCQELLNTGVIYEDRTPWQAVRALPPASIVEAAPTGVRVLQRWWSIDELTPESLAGDAAVEAFGTMSIATCRRLGAAFERPVSDLTAGWDSRLLVGFLQCAEVEFETTVTGDEQSHDVRLSRHIADVIGLRHLVLPLGAPPTPDEVFDAVGLTDGLVNAVGYARVLRVHRELRERFGVSLNGSFGEVARGYWWEILRPGPGHVGRLDAAQIARARYAAGAPGFDLWEHADTLDPMPYFTDLVARIDGELDGDRPLSFRLDHAYLRLRMRSWQGRIASSTDRLWPCLSPLIARGTLESLLTTRCSLRARNRLARLALVRYAPRLAALPLESGGPATPRSIANALRFAPEAWRLACRATNKLLGRRTHARTLEETAAPRLALWNTERIRTALDPARMELGDHVDRGALADLLSAMRRPDYEHDFAFGNLLALELALARAAELRRA